MKFAVTAITLLCSGVLLYAQNGPVTDKVGDVSEHTVTDEPVTNSTDLSQKVMFEVGDISLLPGDDIHINEVRGSSNVISPGNVYVVTGTYRLKSHSNAKLSSNVTSSGHGPTRNHDPSTQPRAIVVTQGEGTFSVYLHMPWVGSPHLSFYPAQGGSSFASVYFGTGDAVMKHNARKPNGL